jgi:hypothetical protein
MVYNAANSQQSNTYQYPADKKVRKLFEVPMYLMQHYEEQILNKNEATEKLHTKRQEDARKTIEETSQ